MQTLYIHPDNPQQRLLEQIAHALSEGKIVAYPTQIGYALITHLDAKKALDKLKHISQLKHTEQHTLLCQDISTATHYAKIDDEQFRHLKNNQIHNGCYILNTTKQTPKYLKHAKNDTIGIVFNHHSLTSRLLEIIQYPLVIHELDSSLIATDTPYDIEDLLDNSIDILAHIDIINAKSLESINLTTM